VSTPSSRALASPSLEHDTDSQGKRKKNLFLPVKEWNYFSTHEITNKQQERRRGVRSSYIGASSAQTQKSDRKEG
jgi:hypothetical protein